MNSEEEYLRAHIAELHRSYSEAIKPFVERLMAIEASKPTRMILTAEMIDKLDPEWKAKFPSIANPLAGNQQ